MRWLVTGASGQLGTALCALLGRSAVAVTHAELDLTSASAVASVVADVDPDVVVNAAAWTAVDDAETAEDAAYAVNATAVGHLAAAAGSRLIHVSTDYVFDGTASRPYETSDEPAPRTAYGRTKLAGERIALAAGATVVRTAWVYGGPGPNFVSTMLRLAESRPSVDVVSDQVGSPTWTGDLAGGLISLGARGGLFHFVNAGRASWCELAQATFALAGHDPARVRPAPTSAVPRPAPRPAWSVLSTESWTAAGLAAPRPWRAALADHLAGVPALTVSSTSAGEIAPLIDALTDELAGGGYTETQTFGYSVARLAAAGVHLVAARSGAELVGIGGIELQPDGFAELKRMYVVPAWRGTTAADAIVSALLAHARSAAVHTVRLETGDKQHAALAFYRRNGFEVVPRFGPYVDSETSVCLARAL